MSIIHIGKRRIRLPKPTAKWEHVCSNKKQMLQIFIGDRDGWVCHYCSSRLVNQYRMADVPHHFHTQSGLIVAELPRGTYWAVIDHKTPSCKGGTNDLENLALCCANCNSLKGSKGYYEFLESLAAHQ